MKKLTALLLTLVMIASLFVGCGSKEAPKETAKPDASGEATELTPIRVAAMSFYNGMELGYIMDNNLDEKFGLDVTPVYFANGATINEALAADEWDVCLTGGAYIFGVANYGAKLLGPHIDGTGGNELYVRADSPIASVKGYNPTFPEVYGSPETVKGSKIIMATGTTSHMVAIKWLEAIGVSEEDVELVNMDFAAGYQAFMTGEADAAVLVSPYCYEAPKQGWVKAADMMNLGARNFEELMCTAKMYEKDPEAVARYVAMVYYVNDLLEADPDLKLKTCMKWYEDNANPVTEENAKQECALKPLVTSQEADKLELGKYEIEYAEFMAYVDKLDASQVDTVRENVQQDILDRAMEILDEMGLKK